MPALLSGRDEIITLLSRGDPGFGRPGFRRICSLPGDHGRRTAEMKKPR